MPRTLTQIGLALMLAPFGIRPKTIWPPRGANGENEKGYRREQFLILTAHAAILDTCAMIRPAFGYSNSQNPGAYTYHSEVLVV
jgi:hypothetical protein